MAFISQSAMKGWILLLSLFLNTLSSATTRSQEWSNYLIKHIKADTEIHQVMLFLDDDQQDLNFHIDDIVIQISKTIPTFKKKIRETTAYEKEIRLFHDHPGIIATLFLIIPSERGGNYLSRLIEPLNFITQFSESKRRPKVLIIAKSKGNPTYEELFKLMWSRRFLDVTVLETLHKNVTYQYLFPDLHEEVVRQHYFNPFTNTFVNRKYSSKEELFPKKLRNLNGHRIMIGLFHYPPYVYLTRNSTGHVISIDGPDVLAMNALSKAINFKISKVISNQTSWGKGSCLKDNNTGLLYRILHNQIQIIAVQSVLFGSCLGQLLEVSMGIRPFYYYYAVVPNFSGQGSVLSTEWKLYNVTTVVTLLVLTWLFSRLLNFESRNWQLVDIIRLILGLTVPREPEALTERIVMGSMLLTCMLHSSYIYTAFTSINIQKETVQKITTFDELVSSDLTPLLLPGIYKFLVKNNDASMQSLLGKAMQSNMLEEECIDYLVKHKNITCFMRESFAQMLIRKKASERGQPVARIVNEYIFRFPSCIIQEAGSPLVNRLEITVMKIIESGISKKWDNFYIGEPNNQDEKMETLILEVMGSTLIQRKIIFVAIFGYIFSFLALIIELLTHLYRKVMR